MARVQADIGTALYAVELKSRQHHLIADEPVSRGGQDAGMAPFELLLSGLGACTAITLRMYAERKQWPLQAVHIDLRYENPGEAASITRVITVQGELSDEQRARLLDISERTPVTLAVKAGVPIRTTLDGSV